LSAERDFIKIYLVNKFVNKRSFLKDLNLDIKSAIFVEKLYPTEFSKVGGKFNDIKP
jgi:hypothetical protein